MGVDFSKMSFFVHFRSGVSGLTHLRWEFHKFFQKTPPKSTKMGILGAFFRPAPGFAGSWKKLYLGGDPRGGSKHPQNSCWLDLTWLAGLDPPPPGVAPSRG